MKESFYWYDMGKDNTQYLVTCSAFNKNKIAKAYGRVPLQEYQAGVPMERLHINFLNPLPKTLRGNEYVLMMVDPFIKWVECVPLPS